MKKGKNEAKLLEFEIEKNYRKNQFKIKNKKGLNSKGITLIALIITIVILIILATVGISFVFGGNGLITRADQAALSAELSTYKEQLELYKTNKYMENDEFVAETLTAGKVNLTYNTKTEGEEGNIKTVIPSISDEYIERLEVIKGELLLTSQNMTEIKIAQALGIEVNPYLIVDGVLLSANTNLALMDENTGSLTLPDSVESIGEGAFANLSGLKTIIIPSTVKRIEQNAFRNNADLETVIMQEKDGQGVEYIGNYAFMECSNLTTVQMANTVAEMGVYVFNRDANLQSVNISTGLKVINSQTFNGCTNLKSIEIPEGITQIEAYAFSGCTNLETVTIPSTVETINGTAFNNCSNLKNIEIADGNTNFTFSNGILLGNNGTEMVVILEEAIQNNTLSIPNTVTTLFASQISQYTQITTVEIPASVINIDAQFVTNNITNVIINSNNPMYETYENAIYTKATSGTNIQMVRYYGNEDFVTVREGTQIIKSYCFSNKNLSQIELPNSLESIESSAFNSCDNLKSITLGSNVKSINSLSIDNSGIEEINISADNPNYSIREGGICNGEVSKALYNKDGSIFISPIKPTRTIETYEILSQVDGTELKEIADYAFHNQSQMTSLVIPNKVEKIGQSIRGCTSLTSIEIPSSVTEISTYCFRDTTNLTQIIIHNTEGSIQGQPWGCIYGDRAIYWVGK